MKFVKLALAALVSSADAMQQKSDSELVSQALLMTEAGSDVHQHLTSAIASMGASTVEARSQIVHVPIDEKRDLTLKSFRKIVGYDTFESIRKKNRSESKDISDYYNVTVSMMIQRKPVEAAAAP